MKMPAKSKQSENESGSKWTTICLDRDFKNELEKQMDYGDSFQSFLKNELDVYDKE